MSLIVRQRWDGKIVLYTKGADSMMLARAAAGQDMQGHIEEHLVRGRGRGRGGAGRGGAGRGGAGRGGAGRGGAGRGGSMAGLRAAANGSVWALMLSPCMLPCLFLHYLKLWVRSETPGLFAKKR
jgi:hypothetical protein